MKIHNTYNILQENDEFKPKIKYLILNIKMISKNLRLDTYIQVATKNKNRENIVRVNA